MNLETVLHANTEEQKREKSHAVRVIPFFGQSGRRNEMKQEQQETWDWFVFNVICKRDFKLWDYIHDEEE
jgi:outer membrane receptor for ferric coprogen and ferric-rhodotorulic acid